LKILTISKTYARNVTGPKQYQSRRFETTLTTEVPTEAQAETPEGKQKFIELSDRMNKAVQAIVERDAAPAVQEAEQQ
jgi:GR25 family glycosyltransferase involved in LPS biosynthesis